MRGGAAVLEFLRKWIKPGWRAAAVASILSGGLRLLGPRRGVALENLRRVYPDCDEQWRRRTVRKCYSHIAWMVAEYLSLLSDPPQVLSWVREVEGKEILDEFKKTGKGVIILTGHVGNWELLAAWLAQSGYPLTAVVRNPDDPHLAALIEDYRARVGMGTYEKHFVMREAVRFAKGGGFLGLLPDQAWDSSGIYGTFFGLPCLTSGGAAAMARLAGVEVVPVVSYRVRPFHHKVRIYPPLPLVRHADRNEALRANTELMNGAIERMIRPLPEQWLWLHRRWKLPLAAPPQ